MKLLIFFPCLRFAYVIYASEESIDQVVALIGTTFILRILKVYCFFLGSDDVLQLTKTTNVNTFYEIEMVKVRKPESCVFLPCWQSNLYMAYYFSSMYLLFQQSREQGDIETKGSFELNDLYGQHREGLWVHHKSYMGVP